MDLKKFTKYITQWSTPLSPKFNYRYVVIGLEREFGRKWYKVVFCENLMDVQAVEYGMYTQEIRYISSYKIADLDKFPRNTQGLSVVGLPFYSHIYWEIGMKERLAFSNNNTQARVHKKNVLKRLNS